MKHIQHSEILFEKPLFQAIIGVIAILALPSQISVWIAVLLSVMWCLIQVLFAWIKELNNKIYYLKNKIYVLRKQSGENILELVKLESRINLMEEQINQDKKPH